MRLPLLMAGLLLCSSHPALAEEQPSSALMAQLPPQDSPGQMEFFSRELDRAEQLYDNLMFDEADRAADLTIARINAFLAKNRGIEGVDEIEAVYTARVNQLRQLKAFKTAAREQMELKERPTTTKTARPENANCGNKGNTNTEWRLKLVVSLRPALPVGGRSGPGGPTAPS